MFNPKPYYTVNREERHFAWLFASALLSNMPFRQRIFQRMSAKAKLKMDADSLEIYLESASLRDFWNDLGDPKKYSSATHDRRLGVVKRILSDRGIDTGIIDSEPMFWTTIRKKKLRCPSQWAVGDLKDTQWSTYLKQIRWSFNAKPDLLIVSGSTAILMEVKVEGKPSKNNAGYDQLETQKVVGELMKVLIPEFRSKDIALLTLTLRNELEVDGLSWIDVISDLDVVRGSCSMLDHVYRHLEQLKRYY